MGRPSKYETRNRQLNLKLTAREHEWVCGRAAKVGMQPVDYGRLQLLAEQSVARSRRAAGAHLDPLFLQQLSRIGNNLNQITRRLHQLGVTAPPDLGPVLEAIRQVMQRASRHDR